MLGANHLLRALLGLAFAFSFLSVPDGSDVAFAQSVGTQDGDRGDAWTFDPVARIELGVISAETVTRDEEFIVDGDGFTLRAQIGGELADSDTRFRFEADRIEVERIDDDRRDYNRDRITFIAEQDFGDDWEVQLRARYYDDLATVESADTDEWQGSARVEYEPERAHRFRVRATWREREYDNGADPQTRGSGPRVDAQYRHRLGRYNYINFDLRAESISSDDPQRGFNRQSAKASYTQPITPDLRIRPAISYIRTEFDDRLTTSGARRVDNQFAPEVKAMYWPDNWRIEVQAKYILTDSNLPSRDRAGYRLTLAIGYVF